MTINILGVVRRKKKAINFIKYMRNKCFIDTPPGARVRYLWWVDMYFNLGSELKFLPNKSVIKTELLFRYQCEKYKPFDHI